MRKYVGYNHLPNVVRGNHNTAVFVPSDIEYCLDTLCAVPKVVEIGRCLLIAFILRGLLIAQNYKRCAENVNQNIVAWHQNI